MARFAGTFWRLVQYARAFLPLAVSGVWEGLFKALADDPDNEYAMIATTIVRAHQHSAGALKWGLDHAIGRSRGGLTTKIHVILDALCNPLRLILTGGQVHDITQAEALLALIEPKALLADKGLGPCKPRYAQWTRAIMRPWFRRVCAFVAECGRAFRKAVANRVKRQEIQIAAR